nr:MAG: hypothetical protein [Bacteriophage sp.]
MNEHRVVMDDLPLTAYFYLTIPLAAYLLPLTAYFLEK